MDETQPLPTAPENPLPPGPPKTSGLAVTSLVLGVLSFFFSVLAGLPAIICGALALGKIGNSGGAVAGKGLAIAGLATGGVGTVMSVGCAIALLLPAVQAARDAARANQSMNNMKQLSLAMLNFETTQAAFPPIGPQASINGSKLSWRVHLLPYLEEQALYEQFHLDEPWDSPHNAALVDQMPEYFISPTSTAPPGHTVYLAVTGPGAAFGDGSVAPTIGDIRDGMSKTVMLVEADDALAVPWTKPQDWTFDPANPVAGLGGQFGRFWNAVFFDGHVERLPAGLPPDEVAAMMTSSGGEIIQDTGW
ncbi:MAG: DUF1559 domain-containing protein [Planctomycetota bacterium]